MSPVRLLLTRVRTSLWFLPALLTIAAGLLAFGTVWIDRSVDFITGDAWFVFGAGAEGARGVLATIAGSIITVTGVVFSITIVVLQLASSQFTPRVVQSFTEDRANQLVLGVFIGTFTYSLLVLRTVRSELEDRGSFVPALSVTVSVLLALVSMGFLIYFINHVARSIQAEVVIDRATRNALGVVDAVFPDDLGSRAQPDDAPADQPAATVTASACGYVQGVDEDRLLELAETRKLIVTLEKRIGDFVLAGEALLRVQPAQEADAAAEALRRTVTLGPERTRSQDLERALIELTDIGIRALSPGVNDPTTAMVAIDRLTQILSVLATREIPSSALKGADGTVRLVAPRRTFAEFIERSYGPLAHHAASDPYVTERIAQDLSTLLSRVPPARAQPVAAQLQRLHRG